VQRPTLSPSSCCSGVNLLFRFMESIMPDSATCSRQSLSDFFDMYSRCFYIALPVNPPVAYILSANFLSKPAFQPCFSEPLHGRSYQSAVICISPESKFLASSQPLLVEPLRDICPTLWTSLKSAWTSGSWLARLMAAFLSMLQRSRFFSPPPSLQW